MNGGTEQKIAGIFPSHYVLSVIGFRSHGRSIIFILWCGL